MTFSQRLHGRRPIVLDGATGHLLESRGVELHPSLWSATALTSREGITALRMLHADYIRAGAELITANTFRTNPRTLRAVELASRSAEFTKNAVNVVREAMDAVAPDSDVYVAGSIGPVEDCYRPELVPAETELYDEHRRHIDNLYDSNVDCLLIETMNNVAEASIACGYAAQTGLPIAVSFVCKDEERLLSGESLDGAVAHILPHQPAAVLVNCSRPELMGGQLDVLSRRATNFGAYANVLATEKFPVLSPADYCRQVIEWNNCHELAIVGGCCGTGPSHIESLASHFRGSNHTA